MRLAMILFVILLSACSGGGGTAPPAAPDPPVSTNSPPSIALTASSQLIDERQSLRIDASATTDPDGDVLSFELSLDGSSSASVLSRASGPVWTLETTKVDADEVVTATLRVSDGTTEVSEDVTFTIRKFDRSPISTIWAVPTQTYDVSDNGSAKLPEDVFFSGFKILHVLHRSATNTLSVLEFTFFNSIFRDPTLIPLDMPASASDFLMAERIQYASERSGFAVFSPETESIRVFKRESQQDVSDGGQFSIPGLCDASWAHISTDSDILQFPSLLIGTGNGLHAWLNDGRTIPLRDRSGTFSQSRIWRPSGRFCFAATGGIYYDEMAHEIELVLLDTFSDTEFPGPVSVSVPNGLRLVDIETGLSQIREEYIALLFAGETHNAPHQLTILYQSPNGAVDQLDIPLPAGIPASLTVGSIDTDFDEVEFSNFANKDDDIVIAVPDTPYAYVIRSEYSVEAGLTFAPLEFFHVGFDVLDTALIITDGTARWSLITNDGWTLRLHENTL